MSDFMDMDSADELDDFEDEDDSYYDDDEYHVIENDAFIDDGSVGDVSDELSEFVDSESDSDFDLQQAHPAIYSTIRREPVRNISPDPAITPVEAGESKRPQIYMGNPQLQMLDLRECAVMRLPSSKCHNQTCDSMCAGPPDSSGANTVTVIDEDITYRLHRQPGSLHSVSVQDFNGCSLAIQHKSSTKLLELPNSRLTGRPQLVSLCYSTRWSPDGRYLAICTGKQARLQLWYNPPKSDASPAHRSSSGSDAMASGSNPSSRRSPPAQPDDLGTPSKPSKQSPEPEENNSTTTPESPLSNLRTCGGILIPELPSQGGHTLLGTLQNLKLMLNCVRIGTVAGVPRVIVAGQNGHIYFFEMPKPASGASALAASSFMCKSLRPSYAAPRLGKHNDVIHSILYPRLSTRILHHEFFSRPVLLEDELLRAVPELREIPTEETLLGPVPPAAMSSTSTIGQFASAINSAEPSPDGNWMCVLCDAQPGESMQAKQTRIFEVLLLPEALDYLRATAITLEWPDVGGPVQREAPSCEGCQYAAWSPDSQYLAVSSDSHAAVAVWKLKLKHSTALDAEVLGDTLYSQLVNASEAEHGVLQAMLPQGVWKELESAIAAKRSSAGVSGVSGAAVNVAEGPQSGGVSGSGGPAGSKQQRKQGKEGSNATGAAADSTGGNAQSAATAAASLQLQLPHPHELPGRKGRLTLLRALARVVWDAVEITHIAAFKNHCFPCLALCFVPGVPNTLVWVEESSRVHVCNVLQPSAHQVVYLRTLPMQMALGEHSAYHVPEPLCEEDNWGFGSDLGDDAVDFQFNPVPTPEPGGPGGSMRTHALSIVETNAQTRHASAPVPYPMALALALARGGRVRVPKGMKSACDQLQKVYEDVLKEGKSPTSELALVDKMMEWIENCYPQNLITGLAAIGPTTVAVSTSHHLFKLELQPSWRPDVHWPISFRRAAKELMLIGRFGADHVSKDKEKLNTALPIWNVPEEVVQKIIAASSGNRSEWLNKEGKDEIDAWSAYLSGLTREQCLASKLLHAIVLPHVTSHPALLAPEKRATRKSSFR